MTRPKNSLQVDLTRPNFFYRLINKYCHGFTISFNSPPAFGRQACHACQPKVGAKRTDSACPPWRKGWLREAETGWLKNSCVCVLTTYTCLFKFLITPPCLFEY